MQQGTGQVASTHTPDRAVYARPTFILRLHHELLLSALSIRDLHIKAGPTKFYISNFMSVLLFMQCIIRDQPSVKKLAKR